VSDQYVTPPTPMHRPGSASNRELIPPSRHRSIIAAPHFSNVGAVSELRYLTPSPPPTTKIRFGLSPRNCGTSVRVELHAPEPVPSEASIGHLRKRILEAHNEYMNRQTAP